MPELTVKIGGQKYKLQESNQEFSVLTTNARAIDKLRQKKGVKNVVEAAPGIQVVKSSGPKNLDTLMSEIRKTGISHHVCEVADMELPQRFGYH